MSRIRADKLVNRAGSGGPHLPNGVASGFSVAGVVTATSFSGDGSQLSGLSGSSLSSGGDVKVQATASGATITGDATISGNLSVNGTTTTIDTAVTSVDSLAVDGSITALGNCGIGTDNPGTKLDVRGGNWANGDIVVGQSGNAGRIKFRRGADGSDSAFIGFAAADNNSRLSIGVDSGDGTIAFQTNSAERLRIDQHGTSKFKGPLTEKCNRDTGAGLTGDYNHDLITYGNVHWATSNSSGTWTYNLRGSATVALNDMMSDGETLSFQLISAQNSTSNYMTEFRIDGTAYNVWWQGGSAPSAGGASGYDVYTFTVFKIADASFRIFAALSNHA
jgi:hypothetical protein